MDTNQKFYIVARTRKITGIGSILFSSLNHIRWAFEQGYIPIVDLKHYKNQYFKEGREYRDNVWEYFFEQPTEYNLDNIPDDAEIIISNNVKYPKGVQEIYANQFINNPSKKIKRTKEILKKYIKFKSDIKDYLKSEYKRIIGDEKDILGVLCRGTDFLQKHPKNETIQPNPELVIKKTKQLLKKYNFKKIYLATEDVKIYTKFKKEFGDMILDNNQYRYGDNYDKNYFLSDIKVERQNHNYNLAKEYLASLYILSKCKYLIGGDTSGTRVIALLSDYFEYAYIWKLGLYKQKTIYDYFLLIKNKIFSIKNKYSNGSKTKHKIITILGLTFKIKVKN